MEESRINVLARFNSERARGIVHTQEWSDFMAREQEKFDNAGWVQQGGEEISPGVWMVPAPKRKRWFQKVPF